MSTSAPPLDDTAVTPMEENNDADSGYGSDKNHDLPLPLQNALRQCIEEAQAQEMFDRRREVLSGRKKREYERGNQHIYENNSGIFVVGQPGVTVTTAGGDLQCPNYIDSYNIFQPFCRTIESVQTQNAPGIVFRPNDPTRQVDVEAADTGEAYKELFNRTNDTKSIQTQVVRMYLLSSRTVLWTRTMADPERFGFTPQGEPKLVEATTVYGDLESKVPILAKCQSACWYCILTDDPDVKIAKREYPWIADKIRPGMSAIGENTYERIARLGVMQGNRSYAQIGDALTHLVARAYCFLRPAAFEGSYFENAMEGSDTKIKDALLKLFPNGCLVTFIGDVFAEAEAVSMDDCIHITFPYEGDGMSRMAVMDPMIVIQDRFNDNMNYAAEVWDYGAPNTWTNADDTEWEAIGKQRADPYALRQKKARPNTALEDEFYREPDPDLPPNFMEFLNNLQGPLAQFITAAPPALFGGAMEDQKTASGYAQARNQAMGQQGLVWQQLQWAFARMYYQAAIWASKNPQYDNEIVIPKPGGGNQTIELAKLTTGTFGAYPDTDTGYPETTMQKRQTLTGMVTMAAQSPVGQQLFDAPDNWKIMGTLMGLPELVLPAAIARDKQALEIEELLVNAPNEPDPQVVQQAMVANASDELASQHNPALPPPQPFNPQALLTPSVPVDPDFDFHQFEFAKVQDWLSSDACRKQLAGNNLLGVQNVRLHGLEHKKYMMLQAAQAMAMAAPPPSEGGGALPGKAPTPHPPPPPAANATNPQSTPIQ